MWKDYSNLEDIGKGQVRVVTLKMLDDRVTKQWLLSGTKTLGAKVTLDAKPT
jgi:hypothetical protein